MTASFLRTFWRLYKSTPSSRMLLLGDRCDKHSSCFGIWCVICVPFFAFFLPSSSVFLKRCAESLVASVDLFARKEFSRDMVREAQLRDPWPLDHPGRHMPRRHAEVRNPSDRMMYHLFASLGFGSDYDGPQLFDASTFVGSLYRPSLGYFSLLMSCVGPVSICVHLALVISFLHPL